MLFFRYAVGYNAGAGADEHFSVFLKRKPDRDTHIHISRKIQIANGTAVNAALVVFQVVDDLTGAKLWCTRKGSGGRTESMGSTAVLSFRSCPFTVEPMCMTWE